MNIRMRSVAALALVSTEVQIGQLDQKIGELLGSGDRLSRN